MRKPLKQNLKNCKGTHFVDFKQINLETFNIYFLGKYTWPKLILLGTESLIKSISLEETVKVIMEPPHKDSRVPDMYNLCEKNFKTKLKDPKVD